MKMEETPFIFGLQINVMKNVAWKTIWKVKHLKHLAPNVIKPSYKNISKYPSITTGSTWQV